MNKTIKTAGLIIVLLVLSQWLLIYLTYAGKLSNNFGYFIANIYNLKAGTVIEEGKSYNISLSDYLVHKNFLQASSDKQQINAADTNIPATAWQRVVEDQWLRNFAQKYNLNISEDEVDDYINSLVGVDNSLAKFAKENFGLSESKFRVMFVEPYILQNKVYTYLLDNYNDIEGIRVAQNAYEALEVGRDFNTVAQEFATDQTYVANSFWLQEDDLVDIYEPIADLEAGEFSRIVMMVGGYVIWQVESITEDDQGKVWEVKSLFIEAKSLDEFFQDYLQKVTINKKV